MINNEESKAIELLEAYYLNNFYYFLKFIEKKMLFGFATKDAIKNDWFDKWNNDREGKGLSSFAVGAERIVYALFNAHGFGQPNSAPVGSDLFFETEDAFIHIDLKTVQTRNIGDYNTSIFVGNNQNSYSGFIEANGELREYKGSLPVIYSNGKICLTFFITILYDEETLEILNINLLSMPNGLLKLVYKNDVLKAGKNLDKIRYNFQLCENFRLLNNTKRIKVILFNNNMQIQYKNKLKFIQKIYTN